MGNYSVGCVHGCANTAQSNPLQGLANVEPGSRDEYLLQQRQASLSQQHSQLTHLQASLDPNSYQAYQVQQRINELQATSGGLIPQGTPEPGSYESMLEQRQTALAQQLGQLVHLHASLDPNTAQAQMVQQRITELFANFGGALPEGTHETLRLEQRVNAIQQQVAMLQTMKANLSPYSIQAMEIDLRLQQLQQATGNFTAAYGTPQFIRPAPQFG
jgi:chromosome segregation ATPase